MKFSKYISFILVLTFNLECNSVSQEKISGPVLAAVAASQGIPVDPNLIYQMTMQAQMQKDQIELDKERMEKANASQMSGKTKTFLYVVGGAFILGTFGTLRKFTRVSNFIFDVKDGITKKTSDAWNALFNGREVKMSQEEFDNIKAEIKRVNDSLARARAHNEIRAKQKAEDSSTEHNENPDQQEDEHEEFEEFPDYIIFDNEEYDDSSAAFEARIEEEKIKVLREIEIEKIKSDRIRCRRIAERRVQVESSDCYKAKIEREKAREDADKERLEKRNGNTPWHRDAHIHIGRFLENVLHAGDED